MASTTPPITLSEQDYDRLEAMLEAPRWQGQPMAPALAAELERAQVLDADKIGPDVVRMNSTVTCVEEISGREHTLRLSFPDEADAEHGRVSIFAPVGAALIGLSVGQSIDWTAPDGRPLRLRVAAVSNAAAR